MNTEPRTRHFSTLPVVVMGGSAGGAQVVAEILGSLPPESGIAIFYCNQDSSEANGVSGLLSRVRALMKVVSVSGETSIEPDHFYLLPPKRPFVFHGRSLVPADAGGTIDVLFESAAESFGHRTIGVLLSGDKPAGTRGLKAIQAEGGITIVQDQSAQFNLMPATAIAAGAADIILPPHHIAEELLRLSRLQIPAVQPDSVELRRVFRLLTSGTGVDFTQYNQDFVLGGISRRLRITRSAAIADYLKRLEDDPGELPALFDELSRGEPEFFHDPALFEALRGILSTLLPYKEGGRVRVWVPGCGSGEQAYSIAILVSEFLESESPRTGFQVFGTDINNNAIVKARASSYPGGVLSLVSPERLQRYFTSADYRFQISRPVREACVFSRHNLAENPPLSRMDLVVCRSLFAAANAGFQRELASRFLYALQPGGLLVLSRPIPADLAESFTVIDARHHIYRKLTARDVLHPPLAESAAQWRPPAETLRRDRSLARPAAPEPLPPASELHRELQSTREHLEVVVEELRSSNAELQAANEELQCTNEELVASREELQSSNEELNTLNSELRGSNDELSSVNDDLLNLLGSLSMPILMTGRDLRIRRFTPTAARILRLSSADTGRSICDLSPRIDVPDLAATLKRVIESSEPSEQEVRDSEGRTYIMRARPYRRSDNRIDGAVLQLVDVSDLRRSLEEIRHARDYAEAIVNTVHGPLVVLDGRFTVQNANAAFYQSLDVSPAEARGRSIFELGGGRLQSPRLHELLEQLKSDSVPLSDIEIEYEGPRAGTRVMAVNARRLEAPELRELILLAFEDVTDRKRAAEARYRRLFESAADGIVLADAVTGQIIDVNPFTERLLGWHRQDLAGRRLWHVEPLRGIPEVQSALGEIRERGALRFDDLRLRARDGREVIAEVVATAYSEAGHDAVQFNIRDMSERRKFERELQETQKLESLGLLAGGIAHDFNNLLTGILGNASLAYAEMPDDDPSRTRLREIVKASERAAFLTRQMLAYAGRGRFVTASIDLAELVRELATLLRTSVSRSVELKLDLAPDLPSIEGDPAQLQQVIMNLVINGAEAIGEGGPGTVEIRAAVRQPHEIDPEIFGPGFLEGTYIQLEVHDTGSGMDEATQARIFDPFFTTKFAGRGLGLSAARGIIKSHGGAIQLRSAPGQGTSFFVLLPSAERNGSVPAPDAPKAGIASIPPGTVALVIDDEDSIRTLAASVLSAEGIRVLTAENGQAGVEMFREHHGLISVVVLDLMMPVMGGEETLAHLNAIDPEIPLVLSSGFDESEAARRFAVERPAHFLQKPYSSERLVESVSGALARGREFARQ